MPQNLLSLLLCGVTGKGSPRTGPAHSPLSIWWPLGRSMPRQVFSVFATPHFLTRVSSIIIYVVQDSSWFPGPFNIPSLPDVVVVSLFLKILLILSVSVFSNNSSLFTIHASKSGSPLFTSMLRSLTEWFAEKGKRLNILMRNSPKDEKLLEKTTYTSVNCLRVFGS